tara:strand:- start:9899 stop:10753 length:855 start_codon:yes stop_codon:yes gene_type:complete
MKKFCFLVQCRDVSTERVAYELKDHDSDIKILTFNHKSTNPDVIYCPETTWTAGRNILLKHISEYVENYQYIIYLDDDISVYTVHENMSGLAVFKANLIKFKPGIGVPNYFWHLKNNIFSRCGKILNSLKFNSLNLTSYPICYDPCVVGISTHIVKKLLPYHEKFDSTSWWISGDIFCQIARRVVPDSIIQFNNVWSANSLSDPYPRNDNGTAGMKKFNQVFNNYTRRVLKINESGRSYLWPHNRGIEFIEKFTDVGSSICNKFSIDAIYSDEYLAIHNKFWEN